MDFWVCPMRFHAAHKSGCVRYDGSELLRTGAAGLADWYRVARSEVNEKWLAALDGDGLKFVGATPYPRCFRVLGCTDVASI